MASELNVRPAELLQFAGTYDDLALRAKLIAPQAAADVQRIAETHGPMGYPAAQGMLAGFSKVDLPLNAKVADFHSYLKRFNEHAATYTAEDQEAAQRYKKNNGSISDGVYRPGAAGPVMTVPR